MNRLKIMVFVLGLFFLAHDANAQQAGTVNLNKEDNGKKIELAPGELITLRLEEPGATGFQWHLDKPDEAHIILIDEKREKFLYPITKEKGPPGGGRLL